MKDEDKTKEELINEIKSLREQSTRFEALRAQHRENEEEGLKRELLLADGQHMAHVGSWERNFITDTTYWSDELFRLFGYVPGEVTPSYDIFVKHCHPEDREKLHSPSEEIPTTASTDENEYRIIDKDGAARFIQTRTVIDRDDTGKALRIHGTIQDISERKISEENLRASEERFRAIAESTPDAVIVSNQNSNIIYFNGAAEKIFGYTQEEILGKSNSILLPDKILLQQKKDVEKLRKTGSSEALGTTIESIGKRKNGEEISTESSFFSWGSGNHTYYAGIVRDITERKEAEKKLQRGEYFLNDAQHIARMGSWMRDFETGKNYWSDEMYRLYGYEPGEIEASFENFLKHVHPEDRDIVVKVKDNFIFETALFELAYRIIKRDGEVRYVFTQTKFEYDDKENIIAARGTAQDITERRRAEDERLYLVTAMEQTTETMTIIASDGIIQYVNPAFESLTGYSSKELVGKNQFDIIKDYDEKETYEEAWGTVKKGIIWTGHFKAPNKNGSVRELSLTISPVRDKSQKITRFVSIGRDVTKEMMMEEQLQRVQKMEAIGTLASGIAHDFNNVLAAIIGRVQLLLKISGRKGVDSENNNSVHDLKKGLKVIEKAALDGAETVHRIQEFSRKNRDETNFSQLNLVEILNDAIEFTRTRWKDEAEANGIKILINKEFSTHCCVSGNAAELREVFVNIINNALDAMPEGGSLTINLRQEQESAIVRFIDTGKGISKVIKESIFDPFFTTKGPKATGLGMSVSYGIITRHKGTIHVDTRKGHGATFVIRFPIADSQKHEEKRVKTVSSSEKACILIVEDEKDVREVLSDILSDCGHAVHTAKDGKTGMKLFEKNKFDMVITDLGMPGMSGWEIASEIKKLNAEMPVAFITGWEIPLTKAELKTSGVDLLINKPFKVDQVIQMVQEGIAIKKKLKK